MSCRSSFAIDADLASRYMAVGIKALLQATSISALLQQPLYPIGQYLILLPEVVHTILDLP